MKNKYNYHLGRLQCIQKLLSGMQYAFNEHTETEVWKNIQDSFYAINRAINEAECLSKKQDKEMILFSLMSANEKCKRYHIQNCHECNRMECCDNINPLVKRIKELEKAVTIKDPNWKNVTKAKKVIEKYKNSICARFNVSCILDEVDGISCHDNCKQYAAKDEK